eukprot:symbB.v1.2.031332.t1/scaffold3624.1/size53936/2
MHCNLGQSNRPEGSSWHLGRPSIVYHRDPDAIRRFLLLQALGKLTQRGFWAAAEGHDAEYSNRSERKRVLWGMS